MERYFVEIHVAHSMVNWEKNVYPQETKEDIKEVIGNISQLKYELQTNKEFLLLDGEGKLINMHISIKRFIFALDCEI